MSRLEPAAPLGSGAVALALAKLGAPTSVDLDPPRQLPAGAIDLIRVVAGDQSRAEALAASHRVDVQSIHDASVLFVNAVMFHPDSDYFRVLGVPPDADSDTLKLHFRWLQKWLHPDRDPAGWVSSYAERVNVAWAQLRREDRREQYRQTVMAIGASRTDGPRISVGPIHLNAGDASLGAAPVLASKWARRLPALVVGAIAVLTLGLFAAHRAGESLLLEQRDEYAASAASTPAPDAMRAATAPRPADPALLDAPIAPIQIAPQAERHSPSLSPAGANAAAVGGAPEAVAPRASTQAIAQVPVPRPAMPPAATPAAERVSAAAQPAAAASVSASRAVIDGRAEPSLVLSDPVVPAVASTARQAAVLAETPRVAQTVPTSAAVAPAAAAPRQAASALAPEPEPEPAPRVERAMPVAVVSEAPTALFAGPVTAAARDAPAAKTLPGQRERTEILGAQAPESFADRLSVDQALEVRRLLNRFSDSYRRGSLQELVVLFAPNARTPVGNLLDLHSEYGALFAQSNRRSLEFLAMQWQALPNGIKGVGRFEAALNRRDGRSTEASSGQVTVLIEFVDGAPRIASLAQDVS